MISFCPRTGLAASTPLKLVPRCAERGRGEGRGEEVDVGKGTWRRGEVEGGRTGGRKGGRVK